MEHYRRIENDIQIDISSVNLVENFHKDMKCHFDSFGKKIIIVLMFTVFTTIFIAFINSYYHFGTQVLIISCLIAAFIIFISLTYLSKFLTKSRYIYLDKLTTWHSFIELKKTKEFEDITKLIKYRTDLEHKINILYLYKDLDFILRENKLNFKFKNIET